MSLYFNFAGYGKKTNLWNEYVVEILCKQSIFCGFFLHLLRK